MLEAMSTGCVVIASATQPVTEVVEDGKNGLLADFFSPQQIADRTEEALDNQDRMQRIRINARETILGKYDLNKLLPLHLAWLKS
jgi:glycosyltransferase involved in cell wall biosynthesis